MFKKRYFIFLLAIVMTLTLSACGRAEEGIDEFEVTFYDVTGNVLKEETVNFLDDASPPQAPAVEGHTFIRWDQSFVKVTEDLEIHPVYSVLRYTVTFKSDTDLIYHIETVEHGSDAIPPVDPSREGYTFTGWDASYENVTEDIEIHPLFEVMSYTVMFKCDTGVIHSTQTIAYGSDALPPEAPTRLGYTFKGWNQAYANVTEDLDIYSLFEVKTYTVTFKSDTGIIYQTGSVDHGEDVLPPEDPSRTGYTFTGWSETTTTITSDLTIYAEYAINTYTLTFDSNGGSEVAPLTDIPYGSTVALEEPTREDYIFLGWFLSNNMHDENFTSNRPVTQAMTLYAMWLVDDSDVYHHVTFLNHDDTEIASYYVLDGDPAVSPNNPSKEGHNFIGWDIALDVVRSDLTIRAQYEVQTFTVEFDTQSDVTLTPLENIAYGSTILLPVVEKEDHVFVEWQVNGVPFTETDIVTEAMVLVAVWTLDEYTITFDANEGAALDPLTVELYSTVESLPFPFREGYSFNGWYLGDELIETPFTYTFKEDITLRAEWITYSIDGVVYTIEEEEVTIQSYTGNAQTLYLPDTIDGYPVTTIAAQAFMSNASLQHLVLGQYVTTIGADAFRDMSALKTMEFSNATQDVDEWVLNGSNALEQLTVSGEAAYELRHYFGGWISHIPSTLSVITFADGASFINTTLIDNDLSNVNTLIIGEGITEIPSGMFRNNTVFDEIVLPEGLKHIGGYAFYRSRITYIHIPASVETIDPFAFSHTYLLNEVTFEAGSQLTQISTSVFEQSRLVTITIPASVKTIETRAFSTMGFLEHVRFEAGSELETIGYSAFQESRIISIILPSSVTAVKESAFESAHRVTILTEHASQPSSWDEGWNPHVRPVIWGCLETIDDGQLVYVTTTVNTIIVVSLSPSSGNIHLVIPESIDGKPVTQIINHAFLNENRLLSAHIPSQLTTLGAYAFHHTQSLTTVTFAANSQLEIIQMYTFSYSSLTSITIPAGVKRIEERAFAYSSLTSVILEAGTALEEIGPIAFAWSYDLHTINLEDALSLGLIGRQAFNQTGLTSIHIPASVETINGYAFGNNPSLETVTFAENSQLKLIGDNAFQSIPITSINIPASVEEIQAYGFAYTNALTSITFGENSQLHTIGSYGFWRSGITSIYLSANVTTLGTWVFRECASLTIYTEHPSKPDGWNVNWNPDNRPVVWGYTED